MYTRDVIAMAYDMLGECVSDLDLVMLPWVHLCWTKDNNSHVWNVYYGSARYILSFAGETLARCYIVQQGPTL